MSGNIRVEDQMVEKKPSSDVSTNDETGGDERHIKYVDIDAIAVEDDAPLDDAHVTRLFEDICDNGLLVPLLVSGDRLWEGRHRRKAIRRIKEERPDVYRALFPNGVMCMVGREPKDKMRRIADELRVNAARRTLKRDEQIAYAKRLLDAGASTKTGRPKNGEKTARTLLCDCLAIRATKAQALLNAALGREDPAKKPAASTQFSARIEKLLKKLPDETPSTVRDLLTQAVAAARQVEESVVAGGGATA